MQRRRLLTLFAWAASVVILLLLGKWSGVLRPLEWVAESIITPAQAALYHAGLTWVSGQTQATVFDLQTENQRLKAQVNGLLVENTQLHTSLSEAGELQQQLEKINQVGAIGIPAKAIGHGTVGDLNTVEINAGQDEGVIEGAAVLSEDGVLVGRVARVDAATSIITLLISPSIAVAAQIQNSSLSPGVVSGEHGLALRMTLIPQTDGVAIGDLVVTSGTDSHIPEQLVIGTINAITSTPGGLFQEAAITPLFDPQTIRLVTVVLK